MQYETLDRSASLLEASCRSAQNLVGLVRSGGVLVQRSKSHVKPENRVLPSEWPEKPLKRTNLLRADGMKRTWRGHGSQSFHVGAFQLDADKANVNQRWVIWLFVITN